MSLLSIFISVFVLFSSNEISRKTSVFAFDKKHYYAVFASNDLNAINAELKLLASNPGHSAFEGALIMKKAGIVGSPKDKLAFFKDGRLKLENAIKNNPNAFEFLFLRYMIQENAPGFLGYNTDLETDKKKFISHYADFEPVVQEAIRNYSKTSKTLSSVQF
jgi:superfamily I DNA and/or RNA helicase